MTEKSAKPSFWKDFVHPLHTVEATRLIAKQPQAVLAARGDQGETVLHWAALNNVGLIVDLLALGLDVNVPDAQGRTPLDWQNSRLWAICVERNTHMSEAGRFQIRQQSDALIPALWGLGGRPGVNAPLDPVQIWTRTGLWRAIGLRQEGQTNPLEALRHLGPQGESALHGWVMATEAPEKHRVLDQWLEQGLAVDEPDAQGRTALWYAIDGLQARPSWHRPFLASIRALLVQGASAQQADHDGITPLTLAHRPLRQIGPQGEEAYTAADRDALWQALRIAIR